MRRHRFAQRRRSLGFSQEKLAERVEVDPSTVRRWESGAIESGPQPWLRPKIAQALQVSPEQLDDLLGETEPGVRLSPAPQVGDDDAADLVESAHLDPHKLEQVRRGLHDVLVQGVMSDASLDDWELTVVRYGAATRDRPAALLLCDLAADFAELKRALARCKSVSVLRRLTRVAAHMSGVMCLTLVKLDERTAFRGWARTARTAAREVDDAVTYSWVVAQEAYGHFYSDDLLEAVHVARHAQAVVPSTPCVGAVLAAALEARALAALGRADVTRAALRQAEAILSALEPSTVVASAFGYSESQLRFHESNALTHLRDTKAAWVAQDRALQLVPASDFMDRAFTRLDRAMCLISDGDAAGATSYALETLLDLTERQRQGIISVRARQIVNSLPRQRRTLLPARELRDLLMLPTKRKAKHT